MGVNCKLLDNLRSLFDANNSRIDASSPDLHVSIRDRCTALWHDVDKRAACLDLVNMHWKRLSDASSIIESKLSKIQPLLVLVASAVADLPIVQMQLDFIDGHIFDIRVMKKEIVKLDEECKVITTGDKSNFALVFEHQFERLLASANAAEGNIKLRKIHLQNLLREDALHEDRTLMLMADVMHAELFPCYDHRTLISAWNLAKIIKVHEVKCLPQIKF